MKIRSRSPRGVRFPCLFKISAFGLAVRLALPENPTKELSTSLEVYDCVVREGPWKVELAAGLGWARRLGAFIHKL